MLSDLEGGDNMDVEKAISLLNRDIESEHAAIIQYLQQAYMMGEGEYACEIEAIAREEMRHLDWLGEKVAELGGDPSIKRAEVILGGPVNTDMLKQDVLSEEMAISEYRRHIEEIGDPEITRLIERIIADEEAHRTIFSDMIKEIEEEEGVKEIVLKDMSKPREEEKEVVGMMKGNIDAEYTNILKYIHQSFVTGDCEFSRDLEEIAIEEMKHLGWVSEELQGMGFKPDIEYIEVERTRDEVEMLKSDIEGERRATDRYQKQVETLEDPKLRELMDRIKLHEVYHGEDFNEYLEKFSKAEEEAKEAPAKVEEAEEKKPESPAGKLTIGSLLGKEQGE